MLLCACLLDHHQCAHITQHLPGCGFIRGHFGCNQLPHNEVVVHVAIVLLANVNRCLETHYAVLEPQRVKIKVSRVEPDRLCLTDGKLIEIERLHGLVLLQDVVLSVNLGCYVDLLRQEIELSFTALII